MNNALNRPHILFMLFYSFLLLPMNYLQERSEPLASGQEFPNPFYIVLPPHNVSYISHLRSLNPILALRRKSVEESKLLNSIPQRGLLT
jgi:hypothetical protein